MKQFGTCISAALLLGLPPFGGDLLHAQGRVLELGGGVVVSSPLVEDRLASEATLRQLGLGTREDGSDRTLRSVKATPRPGPMLFGGARVEVKPRLWLEGSAGWTYTDLGLRGGEERWTAQTLHIFHGVAGLRYQPPSRFHVRGGIGRIRYGGCRTGILGEGPAYGGLIEAAGGVTLRSGALLLSVDLVGQAHSFGTPVLREEGGLDGAVYRLALTGSVVLGVYAR